MSVLHSDIQRLYDKVKHLESRLVECEKALKIHVPEITIQGERNSPKTDENLVAWTNQRLSKLKNRMEIVRERCCLSNHAKVKKSPSLTTNQAIRVLRGESMANRSYADKRRNNY